MHRLISLGDVVITLSLPVLTGLAWSVPQSAWPALTWRLAPIYAGQGDRARRADRIGAILGERLNDRDPNRLRLMAAAQDIRANLQWLALARPRAEAPQITVTGQEHLAAAREQGRGAILWVAHLVFAGLVAKIGLHRAGFAVHHLSHPRHGFSETRFGQTVLNPLRARVEDRFLAERVLLRVDSPVGAMRSLRRRLAENRIVSITASERAVRPVTRDFLDGTTRLGAGAADLAHGSGAPLLPVFAFETEPGRYTVAVEPSLPLASSGPRAGFRDAACTLYLERLANIVAAYPDQWLGWRYSRPGRRSEGHRDAHGHGDRGDRTLGQ